MCLISLPCAFDLCKDPACFQINYIVYNQVEVLAKPYGYKFDSNGCDRQNKLKLMEADFYY